MPKPQSKTGIPDYFCAASFAAGPLGNLLLPKHQLFRHRLLADNADRASELRKLA